MKKMLIVDDSKAMRGFLLHLATELSFQAAEAEDGKQALDTLVKGDPKQPFDLALVDWDMPRMNGIEFIQLVRRNQTYRGMKLLMITANNTEEKISKALQAGADDVMMKPITKDALQQKLLSLGFQP